MTEDTRRSRRELERKAREQSDRVADVLCQWKNAVDDWDGALIEFVIRIDHRSYDPTSVVHVLAGVGMSFPTFEHSNVIRDEVFVSDLALLRDIPCRALLTCTNGKPKDVEFVVWPLDLFHPGPDNDEFKKEKVRITRSPERPETLVFFQELIRIASELGGIVRVRNEGDS